MKKALVFWLWTQWMKYLRFFWPRWYHVYWVSKSGKSCDMSMLKEVYSIDDIVSKKADFFTNFSCIVIAVDPISEQSRVLSLLLSFQLTQPIIVEKPVSYDLDIIHEAITTDNYIFNIDETVFYKLLGKEDFNINSLTIISSADDSNIEHACGLLLGRHDFKWILQDTKFQFIDRHESGIYYRLHINESIDILCDAWFLYVNGKKIWNLDLMNSIEFMLETVNNHKKLQKLLKENYLSLKQYIVKNSNTYRLTISD